MGQGGSSEGRGKQSQCIENGLMRLDGKEHALRYLLRYLFSVQLSLSCWKREGGGRSTEGEPVSFSD